ncbi:MAG: hypothetical protein Kow0062_01110 [Acidobacteriota bacterium]
MGSETRPPLDEALFLVDGTYTVYRSYFAVSRLTAPDGTPTNGVYGFVSTLRKILREWSPRRFAVAFDLEGPTHRNERYEEYKANRQPPPPDLVPQFEIAHRVAEAMGWPVVEREGFEADDVIAGLVRRARERGVPVVIVTADKDLYQLVGDGVWVLNPARDRLLDRDGVEEVFGVPPEQVVDVLALMGDASDNVPGVPGVGQKTALALVRRYGSLDAVLERARRFRALWDAREQALAALADGDDAALTRALAAARPPAAWLADLEQRLAGDEGEDLAARFRAVAELADDSPPKDVRRALKALEKKTQARTWLSIADNEDKARLSEELVRIPMDVDVDVPFERLVPEMPDIVAAIELFRSLGFRSLTRELEEEAAAGGWTRETVAASLETEILDTEQRLEQWLEQAGAAPALALDTETDALDPRRARLVGVSLAVAPEGGAYVPVGHRTAERQVAWDRARGLLARLVGREDLPKIGQNLKYDLAVLRRAGLEVGGALFDTLIAAQLLDPGRTTSHRLDDLAQRYLGASMISYREVSRGGDEDEELTLDLVPVADVARYAVEDAVVTWQLAEVLRGELERAGLAALFDEIEAPLVRVLEEMEEVGIRVDGAMLERMARELRAELERVEREIHELAGHPFNVNSPQQLRTVLFEELQLVPSGRRTQKTRVHSTGQEVLEALAAQHPLPARVLEFRELSKLLGTYVEALPKLIDPEDGRVHTRFHQLGAATGRLSSSDPNLQNIPIRTPLGRRIREAFVPEPGWVFVSADYSQMELRILAHLSGDPELIRAFREGRDIHAWTAATVTGVPLDEVGPELRARAKAVNFGIIYGMSEFRLAREQGMTRDEARAFIEAYFARYRKVREYIDGVIEHVARHGEVRTLFGRRRSFPELIETDEGTRGGLSRPQREALLRQAVNATVQGTGADIIKRAMVRLRERLRAGGLGARMVLQVHDELLLEVPQAETATVEELVREVMEGAAQLAVPLAVDVRSGPNWAAVH